MALKILCSGHLIRHPVGGHAWHHLQYLVGFHRLGHEVTFFEHFGWPDSCYNPANDTTTSYPDFGITFLQDMLRPWGLDGCWCYLAEDGTAHGMPREQLAQFCRECDVYFNIDNINWIPELELCRRRALVDVDPVFTQIGAHGVGGPFSRYQALFTYGENVHRPGCEMPTRGVRWLPTRQPIVLDLWPVEPGDPSAPLTTVTNWAPLGDCVYEGRVYGQKDREYERFISLPREIGESMEVALGSAPREARQRLREGGWRLANPLEITRTPWTYQRYLGASRAEFSVAKHGYVSTHCGWFSDRSAAYLAMGRPVILQDTGFSDFLPCGAGLLAYDDYDGAVAAIRQVNEDYVSHCTAARALAEDFFDARGVLADLLERSL